MFFTFKTIYKSHSVTNPSGSMLDGMDIKYLY